MNAGGAAGTSLRSVCERESKALIVCTYSDKDKTYTTYPILPGGGTAGRGKLVIDGNVWTYPWEKTENGSPCGEHVHGSEQDRVPAGVLGGQAELDADGEGLGDQGVVSVALRCRSRRKVESMRLRLRSAETRAGFASALLRPATSR